MIKYLMVAYLSILQLSAQINTLKNIQKMESHLIETYVSLQLSDYDNLASSLAHFETLWNQESKDPLIKNCLLPKIEEHKVEVNHIINDHTMNDRYDISLDLECLSQNVYQMRYCEGIKSYPTDLLWELIFIFEEIHYIVNDPLFGLQEWNEFETLVNHLEDTYLRYQDFPLKNIQRFFPSIDFAKHQFYVDHISSCLEEFKTSLSLDYQSDYILPCNDLGNSLQALIYLYTTE